MKLLEKDKPLGWGGPEHTQVSEFVSGVGIVAEWS